MKTSRATQYSLALLLFSASLAAAATGTINGTVVDENGVPVKHLALQAMPLDMIVATQLPQTKTDDNGRFSITLPVGRWALSPTHGAFTREKDNYYLDSSNRFQGTANHQSHEVDVTPEKSNNIIEIKLGPRGGALVGKITDAITGAPIKDYYMELAWTSDPTRAMGGGMGSSYRWLLPPDTEINLTIRAKGYQPQEYQNITVRSGEDKVLNIQLQPGQ